MEAVPAGVHHFPSRTEPQRLLLVDPHDFTRECLTDLLRRHASDLVVHASSTLEEIDPGLYDTFHVVLLKIDSIASRGDRSLAAFLPFGELRPSVPVALLCALDNLDVALDAVHRGVRGCLSPSLGVRQLIAALRLVMAGGIYIGPPHNTASRPAVADAASLPQKDSGMTRKAESSALTPREEEVLIHLRQGKPNKVIAFELGMSENTVKVHVSRILKKMNAMNRTVVVGRNHA